MLETAVIFCWFVVRAKGQVGKLYCGQDARTTRVLSFYPLPITHYPLPITHYPLPNSVRQHNAGRAFEFASTV
ncbi:hypothetical protein NIES80_39980 [Dolichospermum planctonicum]|uniref:Uncharacterized protein n=1 Tax=Dolichospermum planctonicum TaxID=136072 RepID=A0A480AMI6_9CYAN|nr:hypothetical protein NIES80_39980 [Dolichospermum planctonicum]